MAGKTTQCRMLHAIYGWRHVDVDSILEQMGSDQESIISQLKHGDKLKPQEYVSIIGNATGTLCDAVSE